jgi:FKBP-type peptidyl-prolyl cis-trans isomerase SlpA
MSDLIASSGKEPKAAVREGSRVTLHFALLLPSGEEVDTTRRGQPATLILGDGNLLPGFEAVLIGMQAGDDAQITVPAADAFGERNPANIQVMPRDRFTDFGPEQTLEPGLMISFQAVEGELPGVVTEVYAETVKIDFNHPLSGNDIIFDVSILSVENA